jgi:hypothetical protein
MFVLDTDVVSELRKVEAGKGHRQVAAWSEQVAGAQLIDLQSADVHKNPSRYKGPEVALHWRLLAPYTQV